jgi:hypothetical protein
MRVWVGCGGIATRNFDRGPRRICVAIFSFQALYSQGKDADYPWDMRMCGTHRRPGPCEDVKLLSLIELKTKIRHHPLCRVATIPTYVWYHILKSTCLTVCQRNLLPQGGRGTMFLGSVRKTTVINTVHNAEDNKIWNNKWSITNFFPSVAAILPYF